MGSLCLCMDVCLHVYMYVCVFAHQTMQSERDKTLENNRMLNESVHMLRRKIDEIKFEKTEIQKVLEQKGFQRNQVGEAEDVGVGLEHERVLGVGGGSENMEEGLKSMEEWIKSMEVGLRIWM